MNIEMDKVFEAKVIICSMKRAGIGDAPDSPIRIVNEVYDLEGNLIADHDSLKFTIEQIDDFVLKYFGNTVTPEERGKILHEHFIKSGLISL